MTGMFISTRILVFRTTLRSDADCRMLAPLLDATGQIVTWNVDLEDSDRVLRVESATLEAQDVIHLVTQAGFFCEELP